jgi:hypothetical protein
MASVMQAQDSAEMVAARRALAAAAERLADAIGTGQQVRLHSTGTSDEIVGETLARRE